jgi:hypothetical protein
VPVVYRLWGRYGAENLRVVTSNRTVTTPQVRDLIWLVALVWSAELPAWGLDTFLERSVRQAMIMYSPPDPPYAVPAPKSCLFGVLVTASRVHGQQTQSCLRRYLKLRAVQPRLRRPASPSFNYTAPYVPYELMAPGWQRKTDGVPYDTPYIGVASWVEVQVVVRAFWRLPLLHDLRRATRRSRLEGWPQRDVDRIARLQLEELFPHIHPHMLQYHELKTVRECLQLFYERIRPPEMLSPHEIPDDAWHRVRPREPIQPLHYIPNGLWRRVMFLPAFGVIFRDEFPIKGVSFEIFRRLGLGL